MILGSAMHDGLYEQVLTRGLKQALEALKERQSHLAELSSVDAPVYLARIVAEEVARVLKGIPDVGDQALLVNLLLHALWENARVHPEECQEIASPEKLLFAVYHGQQPPRPETPLALSTLLARPGKPNLGLELSREIISADRIDALVSFVKWEGLRRLLPALRDHGAAGRKLRLLTTTYTGATDAEAISELARLPYAEVKISFDCRRTRLHAKAWLFHRDTGFSTAYIGSANLSATALGAGLEWMMKVTEKDLRHVLECFRGAFDSLWEDVEFQRFDPDTDYDQLSEALRSARGGPPPAAAFSDPFFELRSFPFQQQILDDLAEQRAEEGRRRHLVVAATGTGKTMIAAFDYRRQECRPRLLFIAHRREILEQALTAFRHVLRDGAFGELLTGENKPQKPDHLFATVQSLVNGEWLQILGGDYWPFVVIDECHHLPAPSYQAVIDQLRPEILLGLTATPERTDGLSLLPDFEGRISAEIRLWHAMEKQLVVPFEYYGLHDITDLRDLPWTRGMYSTDALDDVYTGNDRRAQLIADQFRRHRGDLREARTLGFCVSVRHAEFMARKFSEYGIPSLAIHGGTPAAQRDEAPDLLRKRLVTVLFTCDLYNEGVDFPWVDSLLLLRPTSSVTVFLQQLGRGLRLEEGKHSCLVLDFIGQHRREFRFDALLSGMTGLSRGQLETAVKEGFPILPAGCHLHLDRVAREIVLGNLKETIGGGLRKLSRELGSMGPVTLEAFLEATGRDLKEVYSAGGWTTVRRATGQLPGKGSSEEAGLSEKLKLLLHVDERDRLELYRAIFSMPRVPLTGLESTRLLMLGYQLFHEYRDAFTARDLMDRLKIHSEICRELVELCDVLLSKAHPSRTRWISNEWPLCLHRTYGRREIQTAAGHWTETKKPQSREGVLRIKECKTELLFVTLDKSQGRFSPTTRYEDYAISPVRFHWQSQSETSEASEAGRRYLEQASNGWTFLLFVRPTVYDEYVALGPVRYEAHRGSRPISITWRLDVPIPAELFQAYATLLAA